MTKRKWTKGHTMIYKTLHIKLDRATQIPLKTEGEHMCTGRVSSSCSTRDTCRVTLVTNPLMIHE